MSDAMKLPLQAFIGALLMFTLGAAAQNVNRGQALWYNAPGVKNNATILPCQSCHSQGPTIKMGRTAVMINAAIVGNTGGMGIFNNILNVGGATSVDLLDLQAFLVNPTAIPLAIATAPASRNFGDQALNTTSGVMMVMVSHGTGSAADFQLASANAISISGTNASEFAVAPGGTCSNGLIVIAVSGSCTINLTFTPTGATGAKGASLRIAFATPSVPALSVILTGNATAVATPTISLSATSLAFANQVQSTTSAAQTITLTNSGAGTLSLTSLSTGGTNAADFTRGGTCVDGGTVAPMATCTITYTFTPGALGARTGTLTIVSNNPGGSVVVALTGTGVGNTPAIAINPTTLTFSTVLGQTSAVQNITVSNAGGGTLNVTGAALAAANAAYMVTNGCTAGLATNASCTIGVSFTPAALGANNATLNITHDAAGSPSSVTLTGTGVSAVPVVSRNPATLNFPLTAVGQQSATQRVTFSNAGPGAATISTIVPSAGFATAAPVTGACANGAAVAAGASCFVDVRFVPAAAGSANGTLTINSSGTPAAITVALAGTGTATVAPIVGYTPAGGPLFEPTQAGVTSEAIRVTIRNIGTASMTFPASGVATITTGFNPGDFRVATATCEAATPLQPNTGNCTVDVTFAPAAAGSAIRTAILVISHSGGADQVPLTGVVIGATGAGTPAPPPSTGGGTNPSAAPAGGGDGGGGGLSWQWLGLLLFLTLAAVRRRSA
jgi:Abnormal spindle-like microcephaly-assoc'd, ASPM-SPD-2-Hydin